MILYFPGQDPGGEGFVYYGGDPNPANYVYIDCVDGILYFRGVPAQATKGQTSFLVVDCVDGIFYFRAIYTSWEEDGIYAGVWIAPTRTPNWTQNGFYSGIWNSPYLSQWQENGTYSGSWLVSRASLWECDGVYSGNWVSVSAALWQCDGSYSGRWITPGNVVSEACISGPGNPVEVQLANLMF